MGNEKTTPRKLSVEKAERQSKPKNFLTSSLKRDRIKARIEMRSCKTFIVDSFRRYIQNPKPN